MSMVCPHEGEIQLQTDLVTGGSLENWTLKLYKSNTTPAEGDTAVTYTEADFTGYSAKTLTRSTGSTTWSTPAGSGSVLESGCSISTYHSGTPQSWSATSAQTIYGYFIIGATSGKVIFAEKFASAVSLINPSTITVQPSFELAT